MPALVKGADRWVWSGKEVENAKIFHYFVAVKWSLSVEAGWLRCHSFWLDFGLVRVAQLVERKLRVLESKVRFLART